MTGKVLGGLALVLYFAVVIFIGYGMSLPVQPPPPAPPIEAAPGPQCTAAYPRGFKLTKRARKHPTCTEMDVDAIVWGRCTRRITT